MKLSLEKIPREFTVNGVRIKDHGKIFLDADEMVSFVTSSGAEFDFTRKAWGFYATPSLNGRLPDFGLRAALVRSNRTNRFYVLVVERDKETIFTRYLAEEKAELLLWMDSTEALEALSAQID